MVGHLGDDVKLPLKTFDEASKGLRVKSCESEMDVCTHGISWERGCSPKLAWVAEQSFTIASHCDAILDSDLGERAKCSRHIAHISVSWAETKPPIGTPRRPCCITMFTETKRTFCSQSNFKTLRTCSAMIAMNDLSANTPSLSKTFASREIAKESVDSHFFLAMNLKSQSAASMASATGISQNMSAISFSRRWT